MKWTVANRLFAAFSMIASLSIMLLIAGYLQLSTSDQAFQRVLGVEQERFESVLQWRQLCNVTATMEVAINGSADPSIEKLLGPQVAANQIQINQLRDEIAKWSQEPGDLELFKKMTAASSSIDAARRRMAALRASGDIQWAAQQSEEEFIPPVKRYLKVIDAIADNQNRRVKASVESTLSDQRKQYLGAVVIAGVMLGLSALVVFLVVSDVRRQLGRAVGIASTVAGGDLTVRVPSTSGDEFGSLLHSLDLMAGNLRDVVLRVRSGADEIALASNEMSQGTLDLSTRTERQATFLQETAATMEDLAAAVGLSAQDSKTAAILASDASALAQESGQAVAQFVHTMQEIGEDSVHINEITSVINGIAFQTNILALNAAVEAARAGEQGRGFAIVADEVRHLAQRSVTAAKEIGAILASSSERIAMGSARADTAGKSMDQLTATAAKLNAVISQISLSLSEQRQRIDSVSGAMVQLDHVTQQNAALVEQGAGAASSMNDQLQALSRAVAVFKVESAPEQGHA